jgi:hypothetical protein
MVLIFIILIIVATVVYYTKGRIFSYMKRFSLTAGGAVAGFHVLISILFALLLPNNFLNKSDEINNLYRHYEFLIPLSMIMLLIINLIIFGGVLNLITVLTGMLKKESGIGKEDLKL